MNKISSPIGTHWYLTLDEVKDESKVEELKTNIPEGAVKEALQSILDGIDKSYYRELHVFEYPSYSYVSIYLGNESVILASLIISEDEGITIDTQLVTYKEDGTYTTDLEIYNVVNNATIQRILTHLNK